MSRRRTLTTAAFIFALLAFLNMAWGMFWLPSIPVPRGDGVFRNLSRRAGPFAIPGYSISMPEFDLAKAHNAEYRVAGLSNIGRNCGVHLALHDPEGRWWDTGHLDGRLQIDVLNARGQKLVTVNGRLGDYIWASVGDLDYLYDLEKSFFTPDPEAHYLIRINYEPDLRLDGFKGFVHVRCGGHI